MNRPDPDALLASLQKDEQPEQYRGKLRIYLGASAGVGKTYAMLLAAHAALKMNKNVRIGIVETHGRSETAALVETLPIIPLRAVNYRGTTLHDFDLDEALRQHPDLLLMDELAHTNAEGARHPKRWQDIEELLAAGIDVWSTLNIQHLESLNDAIGGITGIKIFETLPDTILNKADEVVLVDVPVDELLARLHAGKIYPPQQAAQAAQHFFRKGNLIALREIALRRTADRIETDVKSYRIEKSITQIWKTEPTLCACISPDVGAEYIIRNAARLAGEMGASWHAIYVETPKLERKQEYDRQRVLATLKLAEELGAHVVVLTGHAIPEAIVAYAASHNLSKIIIGRTEYTRFPFWELRPWSIRAELTKRAKDMDIIHIAVPQHAHRIKNSYMAASPSPEKWVFSFKPYLPILWTIFACAATTLISLPLAKHLDLANIVMLFLLTVVFIALKFGRTASAVAAILSVASFDFFFVAPRFSFAVSDIQYLITFMVMLAVGLIIGQLTAGLRFQARIATQREQRAHTLFEFARDLSGVLQKEKIIEMSKKFIEQAFDASVVIMIANAKDQLEILMPNTSSSSIDYAIAQWSYDRGEVAGNGTDTLPSNPYYYIPLRAPMRIRGVLAMAHKQNLPFLIPEQQRQLDTFARLIAIAIERVHYVEVAQNALLSIESERLRNSLLSAISHDLRTPLTVLAGLADTLSHTSDALSLQSKQLIQSIQDESTRMTMLVNNLLDMARLQSGDVRLRCEWGLIEEVIGSAIRSLHVVLKNRAVTVELPPDLPLLEFDAVLIERVLVNLIENALKYTPAGSAIVIKGSCSNGFFHLSVIDHGAGLPAGWEESIFEKFTRVEAESAIPGVGLGLAICRAIIECHHGTIKARNLPEGGACFTFSLPLGVPPDCVLPDESLLSFK